MSVAPRSSSMFIPKKKHSNMEFYKCLPLLSFPSQLCRRDGRPRGDVLFQQRLSDVQRRLLLGGRERDVLCPPLPGVHPAPPHLLCAHRQAGAVWIMCGCDQCRGGAGHGRHQTPSHVGLQDLLDYDFSAGGGGINILGN